MPTNLREPRSGDRRAAEARRTLADALARAVASPSPAAARLSEARTSVGFVVDGVATAVLLLDRAPPRVLETAEPGEIDVELSAAQAVELAAGRLRVGAAVARGEVAARGPIAKFLDVDPVLRTLMAVTSDRLPPRGAAEDAVAVPAGGHPVPAGCLAIEARGVTATLGDRTVLRDVDLDVPAGSISVLLGPPTTGRSTLLHLVTGAATPTSGSVLLGGRPLSAMTRSELAGIRREIGVVPQRGALADRLTVFENVIAALTQHSGPLASDAHRRVVRHLEAFGLTRHTGDRPAALSNWARARAALARATVAEPDLLLIDEPEAGLDPVRTLLLADLLQDQHAERGGTMLVVTRDVALARRIADHLVVFDHGRSIHAGPPEVVLAADLPAVRRLVASPPRDQPGPRA